MKASGAGLGWERAAAVEAAAAAAARLSRRIDWLFLQQMLQAEPGWLPRHGPEWEGPPPSPRSPSALDQGRVRLWLATAGSGDLEGRLMGCEPPAIRCR